MTGDPCEVLASHIPDRAHALLFGSKSADATKKSAIRAATLRRVSVLSVYIISTNDQQLESFCQLWSGVPTRMYLMQGDDFFSQQQGRYEGMGVDRLANLRAAGDFHGFPALVFDGGTAATYTAADANGNVLGGGIGPGVQAKLRSLSDYASALPHIKYDKLRAEIAGLTDEEGNSKKTLTVFARSTTQNIITRLCREIACEGHAVIQHFLQEVEPAASPDPAEASPASHPNERTVICTGGDADLIARLLEPDYSKILRMEPGKQIPQPYSVRKMKQMVHYGIQGVLKRQMEVATKDALRDEENILFGQRVAKRFSMRDDDGDPIFRGTITAVHRDNGKYQYYVRYDDGDGEDMTVVDLYGTFLGLQIVRAVFLFSGVDLTDASSSLCPQMLWNCTLKSVRRGIVRCSFLTMRKSSRRDKRLIWHWLQPTSLPRMSWSWLPLKRRIEKTLLACRRKQRKHHWRQHR
jgi:pantothenate kinase type III